MSDPILDAAARKGSAELLILATLADTELHGYDLCRRIAERSDGVLTFRVASTLSGPLSARGSRLD